LNNNSADVDDPLGNDWIHGERAQAATLSRRGD